jgi:hypothetical protein
MLHEHSQTFCPDDRDTRPATNQRLIVSPLQWSALSDIDDVEPLGNGDFECLADIREILRKHGKMSRLGVALLHSHFDLEADEALVETADPLRRELTLRPIKGVEAGGGMVGTIWMLRDGDIATMSWCRSYCFRGIFGHSESHHAEK